MKFTVYQINLTDEQYDNPELRNIYLDTIMNPDFDAIAKARDMYEPVADIEAEAFDHVFEIGNIGPEENIVRKAPMHSISVGDIIVREDGLTKFVAPFGFGAFAF